MKSNLIYFVFFFLFLLLKVNGESTLKSIYYYNSNNSMVSNRANLDTNLQLKIIVHGFSETKEEANAEGWVTDMKNAIIQNDPDRPTVMVVNWNTGTNYDSSIVDVVNQFGEDLTNYVVNLGISEKKIHCIGHSLGSHACAFFGKNYFKKTGKKIAKISGLDPAGPEFGIIMSVPASKRLDKDDATYVDIYHTNGGIWGINYSAGHTDFWINGIYAVYQPGCITDIKNGTAMKGFCSHKRSWAYYTSSIKNQKCFTKFTDITGFKTIKTKFGYWSDQGVGNVYLNTGDSEPYCQ